jgi:hypothetical protein
MDGSQLEMEEGPAMSDERFDTVAKRVGRGTHRCGVLRGLLGTVIAGGDGRACGSRGGPRAAWVPRGLSPMRGEPAVLSGTGVPGD